MKRVLIILILLVFIWLGYTIVVKGFSNETLKLKIAGYKEIQEDSETMATELAAYDRKNKTEFDTALSDLSSAITRYKKTKENYYSLVEEMGIVDEEEEQEDVVVVPQKEVYDMGYLWTQVGLYAEKEGVEVTLTVEKDALSGSSSSSGYTNCNLKFVLTGNYISMTNFIDHLEADDKLAFEIRDFKMESGLASFTVYTIPVDEQTLLEISSQQSTDVNGTNTGDGQNGTVGNETVSPDNSTNTTSNDVSNNTTNNTVNNATSNQTTNNTTNSTSNVANNTSNNTVN